MHEFLSKYSRFAYGAMVLAFLLPFFSVSCDGVPVASVTGLDLVIGGEMDGMLADMAKEGGGEAGLEGGDLSVDVEVRAIFALLVVIAGLVISLLKKAPHILHGAVGLVGMVAVALLYMKMTDGADIPSDAEEFDISIGMGFGLMGVSLGFVVMLIGGAMSMKNKPPDG